MYTGHLPSSAVVDANVLVSAVLVPDSVPGLVLRLADDGSYTLKTAPILIEETCRSLRNPRLKSSYDYTEAAVESWRVMLEKFAHNRPLPEIEPVCRDPNDDHVIATALAVNAGFIVTGDKDLLDLRTHEKIRIVSARVFLDLLLDHEIDA